MKIDIKYMKNEVEKLNKVIEEYEDNYLNLKNCFKSISFFWYGNLADNYLENTTQDLKKAELNIADLKSLQEIYDYIINQYSLIGKRIVFDLNFKIKIEQYLNSFSKDIDDLLATYDTINLGLDSQMTLIIEAEKRSIINAKNEIENYKIEIRSIYDKLEEFEKEIKQKIYKYQIEEYQIR